MDHQRTEGDDSTAQLTPRTAPTERWVDCLDSAGASLRRLGIRLIGWGLVLTVLATVPLMLGLIAAPLGVLSGLALAVAAGTYRTRQRRARKERHGRR